MTQTARAAFLGLSAVFAASALLPMPGRDGRIAHLPSVCPFRQITGLPCPGCGLTRAFVCLGHGQPAASLHWHPAGWLVFALLGLLWARAGLTWARRGHPVLPLSARAAGRWGWACLAVLVLVGAIRDAWILGHPVSVMP